MPLTILAVDDDFAIRVALTDYLELQGYSVVQAADGKEALEMVELHRPSLLITDIVMPHMNGYDLVRRLRSRPALRLLPVVFLTECRETQDRVTGYRLGCDVYLDKPFELAELGAVVRNLLDRAQVIALEMQFHQAVGPKHPPSQQALMDIAPHLVLSLRERQVLSYLSDGLSNPQIGEHLHLSHRTVEKHVSSLLRKTQTNNRAELLRYALDHGLAD